MTPHLDELISLCRHPKIQGRRGEWAMHDRSWCNKWKKVPDEYPCVICSACQDSNSCPDRLWLPPLSDPIQPERGLWGMINWNRWNMYVFPDRVCMYDHKKGNNNIEIVGPTPEIAVCKAIVAQSEEEK